MKRLLLLTALLIVTAGTTGCRCFDWLWRGSAYPATVEPVMMGDPCNPCSTTAAPVGACGPCGTVAPDGYIPAPGG